jgi:hypothetical protein
MSAPPAPGGPIHEARANAGPNRSCGAPSHRRLARRDDAHRSDRHGVRRRRRPIDQTSGVNGSDAGADDGDQILAKCVE